MRVVGVNIRHGGSKQSAKLGTLIAAHDPDVVALSEARSSTPLGAIGKGGWKSHPVELSDRNGTALLALELEPLSVELELGLEGMMSAAQVGDWFFIVYMPGKHTGRKPAGWTALLRVAAELANRPAILIGDFNTGSSTDRTSSSALECEAEFEALSGELGWTDLWRLRNPGKTEYSWYSSSGNGFRLDHAFVSPAGRLVSDSPACVYDHTFRTSRATNHAAIVIDV
jgi:exodeoxyribonuclease III